MQTFSLIINDRIVPLKVDKFGNVWFRNHLVLMGHDWIQEGHGDYSRRDNLIKQEYEKFYESWAKV